MQTLETVVNGILHRCKRPETVVNGFPTGLLTHLQRYNRYYRQDNPYQPEANHDFRFRHHVEWLLDNGFDTCVAGLLEVMVQRRHLEDTTAGSVFPLRIFKVERLEDNRQIFYQEYATEDGDEQFLADDNRELYHRKPMVAPMKAEAKTTSSSAPGMNMIFRKEANSKCDDI